MARCSRCTPAVSNVKIHFKVPPDQPLCVPDDGDDAGAVCVFSNFFTYRDPASSLVFTVFHQNQNTRVHVNASGLRRFADHHSTLLTFDAIFGTATAGRVQCTVDNSTASGQCSSSSGCSDLNLHHLRHVDTAPFTVSIRPHFFPAALLRSPGSRIGGKLQQPERRPATAIVFSNGKYVIVGARSAAHLHYTYRHLSTCIARARPHGGAVQAHRRAHQ